MTPTPGVAGALLAALVLHLLGRVTDGGWLDLASAAALALPLAALLLRPRLEGLQVRQDPVHGRVGDVLDVVLTVRNAGSRPSPPARLVDRTPGLAPLVVAVPALPPGAEVREPVRRTAVGRASAAGEVDLSSTAPFGLIRARRTLVAVGRSTIGPRRVGAVWLDVGGRGAGATSRPVAGVGTEVLGLRPWRSGDPARAVHARSSARHGRPVVLERERDTGTGPVLLCAAPGTGPAWEATLERSCALAEESLRRGCLPVLLAAGVDAPTRPDLAAVLDWHARLDAAQPVDAATVAAAVRGAGSGGTLVLLLPPGLPAEQVAAVRQACAASSVRLSLLGPA